MPRHTPSERQRNVSPRTDTRGTGGRGGGGGGGRGGNRHFGTAAEAAAAAGQELGTPGPGVTRDPTPAPDAIPGENTPPLPPGHTLRPDGSIGINLDQAPSVQPEPDPFADFLAQQRAEQAAREARIQQATQALNDIFGGRAGVFDRFADETFAMNRDRLMDQQSEAARNLKFALARAGQLGGSVDVDKNAELEDRTNRALVEARQFANERAAEQRSQENAAKNRLLGVAQSGNISSGDVSGLAQDALQSTRQTLETPPVQPDLGRSFVGLANTIGQALGAIGQRQGNQFVPPGQGGFSSFFPNRRSNSSREQGNIT